MSPIYLPGLKVESYFTKLSLATASSKIQRSSKSWGKCNLISYLGSTDCPVYLLNYITMKQTTLKKTQHKTDEGFVPK